MKKTLYISVILLTCFWYPVNAKKCSYEIDKIDEFNGKKTRMTLATLSKSWKISFSINGDVFGIGLYVLLPGELNKSIGKGDSLLIKLTGGEILKLASENEVPPNTYVAGVGAAAAIVSDFSPVYQCTKQDIEKIGKDGITVVRVFIGSEFMEVQVKKNDGEKIAAAANCIIVE